VSINNAGHVLRLFCLPHGGGDGLRYHTWSRWLPPEVLVTPIDLPGHGTRLRQPLLRAWPPLVSDLTELVDAQIDSPFALFGHSLGALLAYEIARTLHDRGRTPALLMVAGRNGPTAPETHRRIHELPDREFVDALVALGGTSPALRHQPELLSMYLPMLRADMSLAERYTHQPGPTLTCPVVAAAGRRDLMTEPTGLLAWHRVTTGPCELAIVDGTHFFLGEREFTDLASARLRRIVAELAPSTP
jgi:medium-chain acyl-[acyl-carrier-protein] hydrolase